MPADAKRLNGLLARHLGVPLDISAIEQDIAVVSGLDRYQTVSWRPMRDPIRGFGLQVDSRIKAYAPPFMTLGINLENTTSSDFRITATGRYLAFDIVGSGSEFRLDGTVGSDPSLAIELYRPIGPTPLFLAPYASVGRETFNLIHEDAVVAGYRQTIARIGLNAGTNLGTTSDLRVGAYAGRTSASIEVGDPGFPAGDVMRPTELERSSQRLSETGVFRSVDVRPDPAAANPATRDIVVDLAPRDDLSLEYNIRYTTNGSGGVGDAPSSGNTNEIQFGASLEASNPFGLAKRTRLYGLVGDERALMGVTFDSATFLGHRWRTQVFLFDDQDRLPDIPRLLGRVRGSTFQQTKRWGADPANRWRHRVRMLWGYTFKHVRYSDPATQQSLSGERAGLIYSLIGDTRNSVTDPHRGLSWSTGTELALRALGSEVDYLKLFEQVYYYVPLGARVVWAQGYRLGITPGENPLLLLEGRFRAGGATSVRGFDENMLGPQTRQNEPLGGQAVLIFNQELRFPLVKRLWGGVFYDAGNAFALVRQLRLDALRQSAGAGLRFMFPFGPVRLEHAWVLDPQRGGAFPLGVQPGPCVLEGAPRPFCCCGVCTTQHVKIVRTDFRRRSGRKR